LPAGRAPPVGRGPRPGALSVAGQLLGLAQRMLDLSVDYAAQRKQFGKPIGSFQAVKHHLAGVATRIEFAKPVLYRAAHALAHGAPAAAIHASRQAGLRRGRLAGRPPRHPGAWRHGLHVGGGSADVHEANLGAGCLLGRPRLPQIPGGRGHPRRRRRHRPRPHFRGAHDSSPHEPGLYRRCPAQPPAGARAACPRPCASTWAPMCSRPWSSATPSPPKTTTT
jgi:hypothetical protein